MRLSRLPLVLALLLAAATGFAGEADTSLRGLYLEARTADVYAGHCFANSEVGLTGREAVLAWNVSEASTKAYRWRASRWSRW